MLCLSSESRRDDMSSNDSISPGHRSVHTGPLVALQSLHPAVFAHLPEHKAVASRNTIRITAEVNPTTSSSLCWLLSEPHCPLLAGVC